MKDALIFLSHVVELKFFEIKNVHNSDQMSLIHHFKIDLKPSDLANRKLIRKRTPDERHIPISYVLKLSEEVPEKVSESFIVQQGIGDMMNPNDKWEYVKDIQPIHGIAARIDGVHVKGRLFCFLPLPVETQLPVHINGNFILDSARSGLWQPRDPRTTDSKMEWNQKLFESLASSYAYFLFKNQHHFVVSNKYKSRGDLQKAANYYYDTFPRWDGANAPEGKAKDLSQLIYQKLASLNFDILVHESFIVAQTSSFYSVQWLPLSNATEPSKQAYFCKESLGNRLMQILKDIGMCITAAPMWIRSHFRKLKIKQPEVSPQSVFDYYRKFNRQIIKQSRSFPCPITSTAFGNVNNFREFTKYILIKEKQTTTQSVAYFEFAEPPNNLPLLLTADEQLRVFSTENKTSLSFQIICICFLIV